MTIWAGSEDGLHAVGGGAEMRGHAITALSVEGDRLWAITDAHTLRRRSPSGRWTEVATWRRRANCLLRGEWIGAADARLLRVSGARAETVRAFDEAPGRAKWYTPWGGPPDVRSLSEAGGAIYANVHVGGILRSRDGGETWEPTIDIDSDVHEVLAQPKGRVLAATAIGLAVSDDDGDSWAFRTAGLHGDYLRSVAVAGNTVLVGAATDHRGGGAALYRFDGRRFTRCRDGIPEEFPDHVDTAALRACASLVACGTKAGEVYASRDAGEAWREVAGGLPPVTCLAIA